DQYLTGFVERIDIRIISVPLVGQQFQLVILVVTHSKAEYGKEHPAFPLRFDQTLQFAVARYTHVEVTVRGKDDAVIATVDKMFTRDAIGFANTSAPRCRPPCAKPLNGVSDRLLLISGSGGKRYARLACIGDDRHPVFRP